MGGPTRIRDRRIRLADNLADGKAPGQISLAIPSSVTEEDYQVFYLSRLREVIFGNDPTKHWYDDFEALGIPSLSTTELVQKLRFTYQTPSPVLLQQVLADSVIDRAAILITTPFNAGGATIQLGTMGNPGLVLGTSDVYPTRANQYESDLFVSFSSSDFLQLVIDPAGSTQGEGLLIYKYRS